MTGYIRLYEFVQIHICIYVKKESKAFISFSEVCDPPTLKDHWSLRGHQQWEFSGQLPLTESFCFLSSAVLTPAHCPVALLCFSTHCVGFPALVHSCTLGNRDAQTAQCSSGKIPGICETRGAVLILLQVNLVSMGKSPRFHGALECGVRKMANFRVSCYVDSGVRRELMKPFMRLGPSGLRKSFLLIFILLIVLLKNVCFFCSK